MSAKSTKVVAGIYALTTVEELREVTAALNLQWKVLQSRAAQGFRVGDKVTFVAKMGQTFSGVVEKVNQKTVAVKTGPYQTWRVSPNLLKKVA
jgi:transcription antitermination factor NusG